MGITGYRCCCSCCALPQKSPEDVIGKLPYLRKKYVSANGVSSSTSPGSVEEWIDDIRRWPASEDTAGHGESYNPITPRAVVVGDGNVKVFCPGRRSTRAGVPSRYIRYIYLKDTSTGNIVDAVRLLPTDHCLPWVFSRTRCCHSNFLTPGIIDTYFGILEGSSIDYKALDPNNFLSLL